VLRQAFDAPWPIIQANAVYFSSSMLSLSDDQPILSRYYTQVFLDVGTRYQMLGVITEQIYKNYTFFQVFGILVGKLSRSADAIVRATSSSALGLLLKSSNPLAWRVDQLDRTDSIRRAHDSESPKK